MQTKVSIKSIFHCSLEKAFQTPILADVTKVHTGYGMMPKVTHISDGESWGLPGSSKKIHMAKSWAHKGGFASIDHILERVENDYWKIKVDNFQTWMLGFYQFIGIWKTEAISKDEILIEYTYTLYSKPFILYPLNWLFAKLFWKKYMRRVLENVRALAYQR